MDINYMKLKNFREKNLKKKIEKKKIFSIFLLALLTLNITK